MDKAMLRLTDDDLRVLTDLRHDLHRHPELSGREYRTTERIRAFLSAIPEVEIIDIPIETGVVARIEGTQGIQDTQGLGEVMLRADIDALPQTECVAIPWKSDVDGVMHACGHDLHATALCGAVLLISRMRRAGMELPTTDLVFQPAEEIGAGALMLMEAGLFDRIHPTVCFGIHNWPSVETGQVVCREGPLMAALRNVEIVVHGRGGHGSMPHLNVDPIVCAAAIVQSLQTVVARNVDPFATGLVSINLIEGGSPVNRVADRVRLMGTVRSLSDEVLERMIERVEAIVAHTARAYECESDISWGALVPAVWNAPAMRAEALACVERSGCTLADAAPTLVGEDFAYYRSHVPSFFFWVGSRVPGEEVHELHTPEFLADDAAIASAAQLYAACVARG